MSCCCKNCEHDKLLPRYIYNVTQAHFKGGRCWQGIEFLKLLWLMHNFKGINSLGENGAGCAQQVMVVFGAICAVYRVTQL